MKSKYGVSLGSRALATLTAVLLTVLLAAPMTAGAESTDETETGATAVFSDIAGHWAEDVIIAMYENGYVLGYDDGTFRPDDYITRAETVTVLNRFFAVTNEPETAAEFPDVTVGSWYYGQVRRAANAGYILCFEDGSFGPELSVTRLHMLTMMFRLLGEPDAGEPDALNAFSDGGELADDEYSANLTAYFISVDLLHGYEDKTLRINNPITRAELVKLLSSINNIVEIDDGGVALGEVDPNDFADEPVNTGGGGGGGRAETPPKVIKVEFLNGYIVLITFDKAVTSANVPSPLVLSGVTVRSGPYFGQTTTTQNTVYFIVDPVNPDDDYTLTVTAGAVVTTSSGQPGKETVELINSITNSSVLTLEPDEKSAVWSITTNVISYGLYRTNISGLNYLVKCTRNGNPAVPGDLTIAGNPLSADGTLTIPSNIQNGTETLSLNIEILHGGYYQLEVCVVTDR
jgi:hypothetical protein